MSSTYDLVIIGGGINGCGIAADAAQRGLSVLLLEMDDIAAKTSSNSSNLIHGGLRYLEQYDFALVKKALDERQILMQISPHLVHPLPFVLPYHQDMRPVWLLRTGLFIYDHISRKNKLPRSRFIRKKRSPEYFSSLQSSFKKGFVYHDCVTHDARLTLENALQAKAYGADIRIGAKFLKASPKVDGWEVVYQQNEKLNYTLKSSDREDETGNTETRVFARCLLNAAGPWVNEILRQTGQAQKQAVALVKGSHILVDKLYDEKHAYLLQHTDKRIIFLAPYHGFTMIGTTDVRVFNLDTAPKITAEEIDYLLSLTNHYFKQSLGETDIVHTWSGIRPLLDEENAQAQNLTREYSFKLETDPAPLLNIYGGKITTYRQLANDAVDSLKRVFSDLAEGKTATTPLPGAHIPSGDWEAFVRDNAARYPWLDDSLRERLERSYGSRIHHLLKDCHKMDDMGEDFSNGLYQREVDWLFSQEWAYTAEAILWRRSKLGLLFTTEAKAKLEEYLAK